MVSPNSILASRHGSSDAVLMCYAIDSNNGDDSGNNSDDDDED